MEEEKKKPLAVGLRGTEGRGGQGRQGGSSLEPPVLQPSSLPSAASC